MAYKMRFRPYATDEINFKGHFLSGSEFVIPGSNGNTYLLEVSDKGVSCDCSGFQHHGKCKHVITFVENLANPQTWRDHVRS